MGLLLMHPKLAPVVLLLCLTLGSPQAGHGQGTPPPSLGGFTTSMGIPSPFKWTAGLTVGSHRRDGNEALAYFTGGLYRDLLSPAVAVLGITLEVYGGRRGVGDDFWDGFDGGGRFGLFSPVGRLAVGGDYNIPDGEMDVFISLIHPMKRSGILVDGGTFRINYLPGRDHTTSLGFEIPVGQKFAGRTRPRQDWAVLSKRTPPVVPYTPEASMSEAMVTTREMSLLINRVTVPYIDQWDTDWDKAQKRFVEEMEETRLQLASSPGTGAAAGGNAEALVTAYHREMERAFSMAAEGRVFRPGTSSPLGVEVWSQARDIILEEVIMPYNRLLGQKKKNDSVRGYGSRAAGKFYEWLARETPVNQDRLTATAWVLAEAMETIEEVRRLSAAKWGDSRSVFIPFQLVLKPEEHDSQDELNVLVERAVGEVFLPGNEVFYVENEQFQVEFARMVLEAKDYSVLWIHDVRGVDGNGDPDEVAYRQVVQSYLRSLINAAKSYDQTGRIPQHIIILDQWFFQANQGRRWLNLLQDPLHHDLDLPKGFEEWETNVAGIQDELRAAVAGSPLLQAQALHYEEGWIENLIKVHVNITNPADVSFWTGEILPLIGLPDMIARDHRKIAFFDISEEDPYKGRAMYTGMGIGEHYVGAGWEDRALMARGPAVLSLKASAREVLLNQGFTEDEIPYELKARPLSPEYLEIMEEAVLEGRTTASAMQIHNQVGYSFKAVNVLKATLYTLMPSGAVIKAPDSLWNNPVWGSMMLGHALRGGRSLVIAPSLKNAPSPGFPQMSRGQEMLGRLVLAGELFEDHFQSTGGFIKVGLYDTETDSGNTPAKLRALLATIEENPWLQDLYGMPPSTLRLLGELAQDLDTFGFSREYAIAQEAVTPKLHLKAHLFATKEAWNGLMGGAEMESFLRAFFTTLAEQNLALSDGRARTGDMEALTKAIIPPGTELVEAHLATLSPELLEKVALYYMVGSHNQNRRSFIMDGEVAFVVARWAALHGLPDFVTLTGLSTWVNTLEELEAILPRYEGFQRKIGHWIMIVV